MAGAPCSKKINQRRIEQTASNTEIRTRRFPATPGMVRGREMGRCAHESHPRRRQADAPRAICGLLFVRRGGICYDVHNMRNMRHALTLLACEMNGKILPLLHGARLRLRVENELCARSSSSANTATWVRGRAATTRTTSSTATGCPFDCPGMPSSCLRFMESGRRCRNGHAKSGYRSQRAPLGAPGGADGALASAPPGRDRYRARPVPL